MYTNGMLVGALRRLGYASEGVARAMLKIDRKDFLAASEKEYAYLDVPLPIGWGQTTSAPSIIARMLSLLEIGEGMSVLEVGVGSGYQTALIAELVGRKGKVVGVELLPQLFDFARENIGKYEFENVQLVRGSGTHGYAPESPYDRILYAAAVDGVPGEAIAQLKNDGKLIAPVGHIYQTLRLVEKKDGRTETKELDQVVFVPLV